jgi:hypothetical protein
MPLFMKAAGIVRPNSQVTASELTILETWNTPEEFCSGFSAIADVVIQSATNVTDVPFVGSRMIDETCIKQIEEERTKHIAKLTSSDISKEVWLKSMRGPPVLEAVAKQDTKILWDPEARQKVFFDEATSRTALEVEVVVYAHWHTSPETVPARVQPSVEALQDANEKSTDANEKSTEIENNETEASTADASSTMQPCFLMSTFMLKCDFSLKGGLCGEFTLASVAFE